MQRDLSQKIHELQRKINEGKHIFQSVYSSSKLFTHKFLNILKSDEAFFTQKFGNYISMFEANQLNPQEVEIADCLKVYDDFSNLIFSELEVMINLII